MRVGANAVLLLALALAACARETATKPGAPPPESRVPATAGEPRQVFAEAIALAEHGADAAARPLFLDLLATYPALADYHLAYLAAIDERAGRLTEAAALDDRLIASHPESVWVPRALARRARTAAALGDPQAASFTARALAAPGADASVRAEARLVQADLRVADAPRTAYGLYQEVRRDGGATAERARARSADLERAHPELLSDPDLLLAEGLVLLDEARFDLAVERLTAAAEAREPAARAAALRALARVYQLAGRPDEAVTTYRAALAAEPPPGGAALFELATLLWNRDHDEEARALFRRLLEDAPGHPKRDTARYALGRIAEQEGDEAAAITQFRRLVADGGDAELVREARWRIAWGPYRTGDLAMAATRFAELARASTTDRPAALYWQGRARARLEGAAAGAALYREVLARAPDSYYADLSEQRLGEVLPPPPAPRLLDGESPPLFLLSRYHWDRSQELRAVALDPLAARELDAIARTVAPESDEERFLVEAYREVEAHGRALRLATDLEREGRLPPSVASAYLYPRAYWSLVSEQAARQRLDPYLVLALMRQESLFDPEATSPAAAHGLMQLLVRTATEVAGAPVEAAELVDPATNVRLGTACLRRLLDLYGGDSVKAIAAYNAGEDAVAKWEARAPALESDEFVESISFRETRKYVKAVLGNYRRYRRLYGAPGEQRALGAVPDTPS